ncbi:[protein-PII] uridylyltransferase [Cupriavidus oxalaticus]|jgi:[protein-PII] uridylyltransferase|uniref:Bifunctional uridylyltransferase/uridylyl-removing enzyme n=1 Tax=Cupriavidus oxalaticus TaxID=96344 RepID=A0A375FYY0_9BURK|nr:[protein-PII] uridylyltransferase [Cupriavidus oxalaticus]QEZ46827.1 [protein-PII] uridylyltransferase [Cupriavidus oxalaticus]QRQ88868.1 [protein-PII] uridylyltransferase [Cupriavidus oxalaticus]QRQ92806.1 [protein-PII] uridylyltransferase [Cupriavidus oxalaticus]WQD81412.1 [protein-PII] uridylyltransferase [Cupriavidus oxalaticus]SPC12721.1 Bifunctional uridylyltransferase/uridylyl-removing enzyme (Includes: (Protein-PII) uridylyltransferase; (Protein-PII)-UMP uridylyl-removing enzyme) [C
MDTTPELLLAARVRDQLKADKQALFADFNASAHVGTLITRLRRAVDAALVEAWRGLGMPAGAALVAVGGYGRGELLPFSDVDVLLLLPAEPDHDTTGRLERFIGLCWDLGLEIGSSVRTVDDCLREARQDITIRTSLLEARLVTGSRKLFESMRTRYLADLDPAAFFQAKLLEMRQRHAKYQDTPYALEPNCKESPGGLRDLQVILWMTKAAGLGDSWKELFERGLLTQREAQELARNERLLKTIRARLHLVAGRRQDVLVFDLQTALAESFGYRQTTNKRASEQLMRRYYWAAKAVTQLNSVLLLNIEAMLFPSESQVTRVLNERFVERQGMLEITSDDVYERDPHAILETFLLYQRTPGVKGLSPRTLRGLYNARTVMTASWRNDPENRRLFLAIMQEPQGITHALRLMNQTSVLGRYLINFRRIVGQMQHDLFHVYTVDQHILMVVRNMRRFAIVEHTHEFPFCSQLMASFDKPWVLWVAALFHDIAKGRGGDHSRLGTHDARRFCKQHGIAREDADLISWLVEHHLTMSHVAQKQDLTDPEVVHAFARVVGSERYLTALYLLTVADIRGTSPKVWNAWKGKLLEDLYRITLRVLGGARVDSHSLWAQRKEETISTLRLKAFDPELGKPLWAQLDVAFFLRHDARDIAWLTRHLYDKVDSPTPVVKARISPAGEGLQVAVYVQDQPDLFARICGYFERKAFSIQDAKIHTTRHGYALDTFQVTDPGMAGNDNYRGNYRDIIALVEHELCEKLGQPGALAEPTQGRLSRQSRSFPIKPRVDLRPDERGQYYLLSLSANDRTGLLYAIARVLARHRVSVHSARINTLGERVEDVFLVDGSRLAADNRLQIQLEQDLLAALAI